MSRACGQTERMGEQNSPRKPWYRRRWVWALVAVFLLIGWLNGPDNEDETPAATPEPTVTPKATPEPTSAEAAPTTSPPSAPQVTPSPPRETTPAWSAPTDGTWEWGDVSFGERSDLLSWEYVVLIDSPPSVTREGDEVTVTSDVQVFREVDRGFGDPVSDDLQAWFEPGIRDESNRMNEAYGRADFTCEDEHPAEGESTTCTATFTTKYPDEVQDFHWDIGRQSIGTWPSQIAD